eukprot:5443835-Karenia_brevis.AAC.1
MVRQLPRCAFCAVGSLTAARATQPCVMLLGPVFATTRRHMGERCFDPLSHGPRREQHHLVSCGL